MNERIEQLADQCMTERQDSNGVYVEYFDHKKFAELLVQECVSVMDITDITDFRGIELALKIKKHFGVK